MTTMNKLAILLSFYIIGASVIVYMASKSLFYVIILNLCFLLAWIIATYGFKLFQEKKETGDKNKMKTYVCPMCKGNGWIEDEKDDTK